MIGPCRKRLPETNEFFFNFDICQLFGNLPVILSSKLCILILEQKFEAKVITTAETHFFALKDHPNVYFCLIKNSEFKDSKLKFSFDQILITFIIGTNSEDIEDNLDNFSEFFLKLDKLCKPLEPKKDFKLFNTNENTGDLYFDLNDLIVSM